MTKAESVHGTVAVNMHRDLAGFFVASVVMLTDSPFTDEHTLKSGQNNQPVFFIAIVHEL